MSIEQRGKLFLEVMHDQRGCVLPRVYIHAQRRLPDIQVISLTRNKQYGWPCQACDSKALAEKTPNMKIDPLGKEQIKPCPLVPVRKVDRFFSLEVHKVNKA